MHALDVNSDAIATAVLTFADDTSTVNGDAGAGPVKNSVRNSAKSSINDPKAQRVLKEAQGRATR